MVEYCKKWSLFVIWVLFKLIWENEERSELQQHRCRNSEKKVGEKRKKWCDGCGREKKDFGNDIAKNLKKKKNLNCGNWIAEIWRLKKKKEKKKTEMWQE